jgi:hypothetical protein
MSNESDRLAMAEEMAVVEEASATTAAIVAARARERARSAEIEADIERRAGMNSTDVTARVKAAWAMATAATEMAVKARMEATAVAVAAMATKAARAGQPLNARDVLSLLTLSEEKMAIMKSERPDSDLMLSWPDCFEEVDHPVK